MVCWNELWPYWENCTTLWDYQGKFHLQIGLLYHMNSIKFHNPTTDCTYLAAFLILNSGEVWSASSQTCRKWRNALERRSCARKDWRCWTKRPITEKIRPDMGSRWIRDASCFYCGKKGSQTWIWDGEWGNMQEEPAIRSINIQEAFDMPLASRSHHIWLELTVLCLIAEARCVWCTYVLLLRKTMESRSYQIVQWGGFFMMKSWSLGFTVCGGDWIMVSLILLDLPDGAELFELRASL